MRGTPKNVLRFLGTPTRPLATYGGGWRATHASPLRRSSGAALFLLYSAEGGSLSVGFRRDRPQVDYLVIDRLSKRFDSHGQAACRDVSFSVGEREFVALIGPSGCGKSTLLHIAAGLSPASSGAVLFKGKAVAAPQPDMMYIFQQYNKSIFPWKSVIDNVCLGVKYRLKLPRQQIEKLGREQLRLVGLDRYAAYLPYQLSGGILLADLRRSNSAWPWKC